MREGKFIQPTITRREDGITVIDYGEVRWPDVVVNSHTCAGLPHHERFRQLAHGYLSSAKSLSVEIGEKPEAQDWSRASAACFCFYHSVELFLKACILFKCPDDKVGYTHDVAELKTRYHELYPSDKYFAFQCAWDVRVKDIEATCGVELSGDYFDGKSDQAFRYLADKKGDPPEGVWNFAPGMWLSMMEHFEEDMDRVWGNIRESAAT